MTEVAQQGLKPFKTVIFGDYTAQRYGNTVVVRGKDGSTQTMEMKEFMKFLAENVPQVKSQPAKDTFVKTAKAIRDGLVKADEIDKKDNPLTAIGKAMNNMTKLREIKEDDGSLTKISKFLHNRQASMFNPLAFNEVLFHPTKY